MKKTKEKQIGVVPAPVGHYDNGEEAPAGTADVAVNLRRCGGTLTVVGQPRAVASVPAGHRLLLVDGGNYLTYSEGKVYCNSVLLTSASGVVGAHRVGPLAVIVTSGGLIYLLPRDGGYDVVDPDDAVPEMDFSPADGQTVTQSLDGASFAEPYQSWTAPLAAADVASLTSRFRQVWDDIVARIGASGSYCTPLQVCYAVRMHDDNYLWISQPVTIGLSTLSNVLPVTASVTTTSSRYTAYEATQLSMSAYRVGITVSSSVGQQWRSLVKSVDVFVTSCPAIASRGSLYYRCLTTSAGARVPSLQYGWQALDQSVVMASLAASGWTLLATTTDLDSLADGRFVADNVDYMPSSATSVVLAPMAKPEHLTRSEAQAIARGCSDIVPVASVVNNGRLFLAAADGTVSASAFGNVMSTVQVRQVTGAAVHAIAPVSRPIYSGGFGRYAVYLFTKEGIYAVAQSATGTLGEARLVDRAVAVVGCVPVEGSRDVYFIDSDGWLCRLESSRVQRLMPDVPLPCTLGWNASHRELWVCDDDGRVTVVDSNGGYVVRTVGAVQVYSDFAAALLVGSDGTVRDITVEDSQTVSIDYLTQPIVIDRYRQAVPRAVLWSVNSPSCTLSLELLGERGRSCHGALVARLCVSGDVNASLPMHVVSSPCRSVRLQVTGTALTGTILDTNILSVKSLQ